MIIHGDALQELKKLDDNSVHLILTDPPYFLDKLDNNWNTQEVEQQTKKQIVSSLPAGMKLDKQQGKNLYKWYKEVSIELYRVLKPGGFFFSFSAPRLYHNMASSVEDAGFIIRDCFMWLYTQNQPKAMSVSRFDATIPNHWKTPQLKSCFEPIVVAQKPPEENLYKNFIKHGVGLFNTDIKLGDNMFPANCFSTEPIAEELDRFFLIKKPKKDKFNFHKTVKPVELMDYIIQLSTQENQVVMDCFAGSGSTLVSAKRLNRQFIGIEINQEYIEIIEQRINNS